MVRDYKKLAEAYPLDRIREILYPTDHTYEAESLDIEDAKWLLQQYDVLSKLADSVAIEVKNVDD